MKEEEIRPAKIFDEYLRLTKEDTKTYFSTAERKNCCCPACGSHGRPAFTKYGFVYESCQECYSSFVNPRPVAEAFSKYYTESPARVKVVVASFMQPAFEYRYQSNAS